ncbi:ATP-binding protein [Microcoleus sp. F10-C6]|uniref:ATP-binding protein n=1 Tax=unclassified Microcoleus TaxID=2642155 RepID=UPI002FD46421
MPQSISQPNSRPLRLRPRARILRTLGDELISSETVAVIELVKNAYDADATRVLVRFHEPLQIGKGKIEIIDNGNGMSLNTIENTWMEPATLAKKRQQRSTRRGRRVLGEKGIGRFASSRLGNFLEVVSRSIETDREVRVIFDWSQFDNEQKYLDEIDVLCEETAPQEICLRGTIQQLWNDERQPNSDELNHGTILRMEGLRAAWDINQLQDLRQGLSRLVSPFFDSDEFQIHLDLPKSFESLSGIVRAPESLSNPHYSISGTVNNEGSYALNIKLKGQNDIAKIENKFTLPNNSHPQCGAFSIELRIWDLDDLVNESGSSTIKEIRRDLSDAAGINIYRDKFRVLPYGEARNDWLRLDLRRVNNPTLRISNNQVVGYIHISADDNPQLRDQSNREGLMESQAFEDLRQLVTMVLAELETRRYKVRRPNKAENDISEGEQGETSGNQPAGVFSNLNLKRVRKLIEQRYPKDAQLLAQVEEQEKEFDRQIEAVQETLSRYRRLSVLGQLIDAVLHNSRAPLAKVRNEADLGLRDIERSNNASTNNGTIIEKLKKRIESILSQVDVLAGIFRRIEPFGGRKRGRPAKSQLETIIADAFSVLGEEIARAGVKVSLPETNTEVTVEPTEIQEIIINLLQNSLYWLDKVPKDERQIIVQIQRPEFNRVEICFSDSGPGVKPEIREQIFDPYFSSKPNGIGLGLTIVGEIIREYYNGDLELRSNGPLSGATFLVKLRKRV